MCVETSNLARSRQQRVILPVHYPGRVHRTNAIPAYPTRTSMDSHGNPVTLLTVDRHGEQSLYSPQSLQATCPLSLPRSCGLSPVLTAFTGSAWTHGCCSTTPAPTVDTTS